MPFPIRFKLILTLLTVLILTYWTGASGTDGPKSVSLQWQDKVDPLVLDAVQGGKAEFLVILKTQADLTKTTALKTKGEKGAYVFETLTKTANATQKPIRELLRRLNVEYRAFWVTNMFWVYGDAETLQQVSQQEEVAQIVANPMIKFPDPQFEVSFAENRCLIPQLEWNIQKINAPKVWSLGYTGQGIVIGGQDTGYEWDHPALIETYRGWNGASVDHNYNWHDGTTSIGGGCEIEPCDDHGHGTHTMGIMVGDDGGNYQVGVAPGAKWIGCRNMKAGVGSPATYAECYQWFIAPTDLNGENSDPSKAPHVINNSWSCPESESCDDPNILLPFVQSVRAAGIVTVHSAGNSGSSCQTVDEPAAIYEESFTVGATSRNDNITYFSSRGPVTIDNSKRLKPNITAPGSDICSSDLNGSYSSKDGTSMAAPHVAGLVALLLSANPDLIGQVDRIEDIIETTAIPRTTSQDCGSIPGSNIPNNTYGWGRVDAWKALNETINIFYFPITNK